MHRLLKHTPDAHTCDWVLTRMLQWGPRGQIGEKIEMWHDAWCSTSTKLTDWHFITTERGVRRAHSGQGRCLLRLFRGGQKCPKTAIKNERKNCFLPSPTCNNYYILRTYQIGPLRTQEETPERWLTNKGKQHRSLYTWIHERKQLWDDN